MSHSYTYTKNFIQSQVNILNEPYRINSRIRNILAEQDEITESELQTILNLLNNEIKECNDELFPSQINNQIVSQILKLEKQKLKIVNSQLFKINSFIKPITLPDFDNLTNQDQNKKLAELREQIKELPDSKYLFVSNTDTTDIQDEYDLDDDDQGQDIEMNHGKMQDDQEEVASTKQMKKEFIQEIADKVNDSNAQPDQELIEKYDKLRTDLIDISDRLQYKSGN
ncbi:Kinetochore complex Fta4 of Sim4 subunit, or CENP-50 family protein [Candida albicans]|uniref:Kinetochore complex Fta4 of Sim4 subunit, or CENP-50 family protein n=1 Tax=Candida albicans TaxID=5476 RepID=A0A8H6F6C3_CANAX|nr:Kinetochore complex Fta4 of Sim4 subunit, or CENP-50 family protein [Candida albicans]